MLTRQFRYEYVLIVSTSSMTSIIHAYTMNCLFIVDVKEIIDSDNDKVIDR